MIPSNKRLPLIKDSTVRKQGVSVSGDQQKTAISTVRNTNAHPKTSTIRISSNQISLQDEQNALRGIINNIEFNGLTPTSQKVMDHQMEAALFSIETGVYGVWRSNKKDDRFGTIQDCSRIGPNSTCFCGHLMKEHSRKGVENRCLSCKDCKRFEFVPTTPEEIGEFWISQRKTCK